MCCMMKVIEKGWTIACEEGEDESRLPSPRLADGSSADLTSHAPHIHAHTREHHQHRILHMQV